MPLTRIKLLSSLLFIAFALYMFLFFRTYIIERQHQSIETNIHNTQQYIKKSIDYLLKEKKQNYLKTSSIIFSDKKILRALKNKNRKAFYQHTKPYFDRAKKRDNNFWGLHVILPNNMSFIRLHKPLVADKLIKKGDKPLIDYVNEKQTAITSFEAGKFSYFLRVVTPIFSPGKHYLGVAEFSINVDSLTQYIKSQYGYEALFLVDNVQDKQFLSTLPKMQHNQAIFKSTNAELFNHYDISDSPLTQNKDRHKHFNFQGASYSTVPFKLGTTATLVVAFDVTSIIKNQLQFEDNVTALIIFVILAFFVIGLFATILYLKQQKQIANELQKSHDILSDNVIYAYTDLNGLITDVSDAFCKITGYTRKEVIGSTHNILRHPDTKDTLYHDLWHTIKNDRIWKGELKNLCADGSAYWVESTVSPRYDSKQNKIGYMSIQTNINDKKTIERNSITDSLCDVYNRRYFDEVFPKFINIAKRNNEKICLVIIDVDYFKQYNDIYGHQAGDDALKLIASVLQNSLRRPDDYCFRLGGEEFAMIFKAKEKDMSLALVEKIRKAIEMKKIIHSGSEISDYITASFGLVCKPAKEILNQDEIYKEADDQLYQAKTLGRNRIESNIIHHRE